MLSGTLPPDIKQQFLQMTAERLVELRALRRALEAHPGDVEALHGILALAHKIAGTAASFGFDRLGACAEELEALGDGGGALAISHKAGQDPHLLWSLSLAVETEIEAALRAARD